MDELRDISSDSEKDDTKMYLCAKYCVLLGALSVCIDTVDTDVHVLSFYCYAHVNNHFLTLNFPLYINVLEKSEEPCRL